MRKNSPENMSEEELSYDNDVVNPSYIDIDSSKSSECRSTRCTKKMRTLIIMINYDNQGHKS